MFGWMNAALCLTLFSLSGILSTAGIAQECVRDREKEGVRRKRREEDNKIE